MNVSNFIKRLRPKALNMAAYLLDNNTADEDDEKKYSLIEDMKDISNLETPTDTLLDAISNVFDYYEDDEIPEDYDLETEDDVDEFLKSFADSSEYDPSDYGEEDEDGEEDYPDFG